MAHVRSGSRLGLSDAADDSILSIPWQKPPSRRSRQILIPHGIPKSEIRPTRIERRARLVNAIARGRRWLDEIVSGSVTDVQQIDQEFNSLDRNTMLPPPISRVRLMPAGH